MSCGWGSFVPTSFSFQRSHTGLTEYQLLASHWSTKTESWDLSNPHASKRKIDFLLYYTPLGPRRGPPNMYGLRETLVVPWWPTLRPHDRRSQRDLWPGLLRCGRKLIIHCHISPSLPPPPSLLSGAYRLKKRLRHFVEELRLRYVHSLSYLSATDDPQYAGVPTGEIKLPDTRFHHCRASARRTEGQRVFNHACFTAPPRLVKSWWPLMTKGIAEMMKRNGPRGERIGEWALAGEEDEDAIAEMRLARSQMKGKCGRKGGRWELFPAAVAWVRLEQKVNSHHATITTCSCTTYRVSASSVLGILKRHPHLPASGLFILFCS